MPARIYTDDQIDRVCELRESGMKIKDIASLTGVKSSSVNLHCLLNGIAPPPENRAPQVPPRTYVRGGRVVRQFTPDEDTQIADLSSQGVTMAEISRRTGRARHTIKQRLCALARRDNMKEEGNR